MKRYAAIRVLTEALTGEELIVSSNGMISRELFSLADSARNFYMIGSMGLASSLALGLALNLPRRRIVAIDGDGSLLMNLGSLATIGHYAPANLLHVVLDNQAHDTTGGQETVSGTIRLEEVARAAGFRFCRRVSDEAGLAEAVVAGWSQAPAFILARVERGGQPGVPRVSRPPEEIAAGLRRQARGG